ncbi:MAG: hypothetical protein NZM18_02980 [Thermoflexales bacterium]|nr:hypothetical protein [Thermoflexales bacterium]MDW8350882.1 hypothetical protein [Anaerolineae bacterium]
MRRSSGEVTQSGLELHDRFTRGESLTPEEQAALQAWYVQEQQEELHALNLSPLPDIVALQDQVRRTLKQLAELLTTIERLEAENAALRQENAHLRAQLAKRIAQQQTA